MRKFFLYRRLAQLPAFKVYFDFNQCWKTDSGIAFVAVEYCHSSELANSYNSKEEFKPMLQQQLCFLQNILAHIFTVKN